MNDAEMKNISLLYEFDRNSPLFARIAFAKMEEGNLTEAKEILEEGLKKFSHYATSYFLLALVNAKLGENQLAKENLEKASSLLGDKGTANFYEQKISEIENKLRGFETPRSTELNGELAAEKTESETFDAAEENKPALPLEERLDELAEQLQRAKIPIDETAGEEVVPEQNLSATNESIIADEEASYEDLNIASETLGMILESQGKFQEAVEVYEKLIEMEPEKRDIYESKIRELKERIAENDE